MAIKFPLSFSYLFFHGFVWYNGPIYKSIRV